MKKNFAPLLFISLLMLLFACKNENKNYALISGTITNPKGENLLVTNDSATVRKITLNSDGTFSDTIFNASGRYTLSDGSEYTNIYLQNGFDLNLTLDTKAFDETLTYSGKGADINNYLASKLLEKETGMGNLAELYALDEEAFLQKNNAFEDLMNAKLKGLPSSFVAMEKKSLEYDRTLRLLQYENYHRSLAKDPGFKVSDKFPDPLKNIRLDNEEEFKNNPDYRNLILSIFQRNTINRMQQDSISYTSAAIEEIKGTKSKFFQEKLAMNLTHLLMPGNDDNEELYQMLVSLTPDEKTKAQLTKRIGKLRLLAKGKPSPAFEKYENYADGVTSLSDLKGKYVYIDVWATWCGPCKAEIPFLKEMEEKYHKNKNIAFVSISIDELSQRDKWREMIKEKEMGGIQLLADNAFKSSFVTDYGISGIPHFLFLDDNGNIVSTDAPRPSMKDQLEKLFQDNGISPN